MIATAAVPTTASMEAIVMKEMAAAGFGRVGRYDFTKADGQDYFLIFTAR